MHSVRSLKVSSNNQKAWLNQKWPLKVSFSTLFLSLSYFLSQVISLVAYLSICEVNGIWGGWKHHLRTQLPKCNWDIVHAWRERPRGGLKPQWAMGGVALRGGENSLWLLTSLKTLYLPIRDSQWVSSAKSCLIVTIHV